jgi:hypothetical protein
MNLQNWVWDLVGWAALPIVAVLIIVFVYRRSIQEFPLFFSYLLATELVGVVRLAWFAAPFQTYYFVYWISDIVYTLFALMAAYELFFKRLFPGFYKVRFYRYIFLGAALCTTALAIAIALISGHIRVLLATVYVYSFVRAAVLFFFVALMLVMGRQWNKQEFAIAFGFGLDVSTSLAALGIWSHTPRATLLINRTSEVAYDVACLIWLYCFWTAPKASEPVPPSLPPEALHEAKKWEESLKGFITPGKR